MHSTIRALEEHAELHERLAARSDDLGLRRSSAEYADRATEARHQAQLIRRAILRGDVGRDPGVFLDEPASAMAAIAEGGHRPGPT